MLDPVMCSDGQTFDRASIFRWFAQCDAEGRVCTSPTTGAVLTSDALLPNVLVRAMMEDAGIETQASAYRGGLSHTGARVLLPSTQASNAPLIDCRSDTLSATRLDTLSATRT